MFAEKWMSISVNMGILNFRYNNFIKDPYFKDEVLLYTPILGVRYEFGINRISLAADINYMQMFPISFSSKPSYKENTRSFFSSAFQFGLHLNWFFIQTQRLSYYAGIFGGFEYKSLKFEINDGATATDPRWKSINTGYYGTLYAGIKIIAMRYTSKNGFFFDIPFLTIGYPFDIGICSSFTFGWRFWSR